ncbi:hypothetical protein [Spiroplasma sp. DGKH1]|uniref:hypothetical protein n=1 Tax=Spiroplasma sp. DGKH1 TaxID=3050074 RepID=UPI0034C6A2C8
MNTRYNLKCSVCNQLISIRSQVSTFVDSYIAIIYCGNCKTEIKIKITDVEVELLSNSIYSPVKSLDDSSDDEELFFIELAPDFFTTKMKKYSNIKNTTFETPFLNTISDIKHKNYDEYMKKIMLFLVYQLDWPKIKTINDLWVNKQYEYIQKYAEEILDKWGFLKEMIKLGNENEIFEIHRYLHYVQFYYFAKILGNKMFYKNIEYIQENIKKLITTESGIIFLDFFSSSNLLDNYENKLIDIMNDFNAIFIKIIPVFSLDYFKDLNLENYGMTSVSFYELISFYEKAYENLIEVSMILIGLNNIRHRNNYDELRDTTKETFTEFIEKDKGKGAILKEKFLGDEEFDKFIIETFDSELRNAFAHRDYHIDWIEQSLTYYSKKSKTNIRIFLVDLAYMCMKIMYTVVYLNEIIYQVKRFWLLKSSPNIVKNIMNHKSKGLNDIQKFKNKQNIKNRKKKKRK